MLKIWAGVRILLLSLNRRRSVRQETFLPSMTLLGTIIICLPRVVLAEYRIPTPPTSFDGNIESHKREVSLSGKSRSSHALETMIELQGHYLFERLEFYSHKMATENKFDSSIEYFEHNKNIRLNDGRVLVLPQGLIEKMANTKSPRDSWAAIRLIIEMEDLLRDSKILNTSVLAAKVMNFPIWDDAWPGVKVARYYQGVLFAVDKTLGPGVSPEVAVAFGNASQDLENLNYHLEEVGKELIKNSLAGKTGLKALSKLERKNPFSTAVKQAINLESKLGSGNSGHLQGYSADKLVAAGLLGATGGKLLEVGIKFAWYKYQARCDSAARKLNPELLKPVKEEDEPEDSVLSNIASHTLTAETELPSDLEVKIPIEKKHLFSFLPTKVEIESRSGIKFTDSRLPYRIGYWITAPSSIFAVGALTSIHLLGLNPAPYFVENPMLRSLYLTTGGIGLFSLPFTSLGVFMQQMEDGGFSTSYTNYNRWRFKLIIENLTKKKNNDFQ